MHSKLCFDQFVLSHSYLCLTVFKRILVYDLRYILVSFFHKSLIKSHRLFCIVIDMDLCKNVHTVSDVQE